jgi:hypothetical protein
MMRNKNISKNGDLPDKKGEGVFMRLFHLFQYAIFVIVFLFFFSSVFGADLVKEGTAAFQQGNYQRAAEAFANVEQKSPEDLRIVFNHGAALAASGKLDEATETLRKSAVARDPAIAAKSLNLLGRIAVDRVKQLVDPDSHSDSNEISPETRQEILHQLFVAEKYYTESLSLQMSEMVRTNLEQIRAWKSRTLADWEAADRSQKRTEDVTQRLQWLEEWEENIKNSIRQTNETPDSPKKFQTFYESAQEQKRLTEEIAVLNNDFKQELEQQKLTGNNISEEHARATELLLQEFEQIQTSAENVAESLRQFHGNEAENAADETATRLNFLRVNLAPFEMIVREAEKKQAILCNDNPIVNNDIGETHEIREQSVREKTVSAWTQLMISRAKNGLETMETGETNEAQQPQNGEALRKAMELAVQTGPEIQTLTEEASRLLADNQPREALPKQKQSLEMLREILKLLQQDQNQQDQNQQNQNQQDQQNQDQRQNQNQQDQQNQDQSKNNSQEQQSETQSEQQKQQEQQKKDSASQDKEEEIEKAERMLRQIKRRQQEADEKREQIRMLMRQLSPVEKDW